MGGKLCLIYVYILSGPSCVLHYCLSTKRDHLFVFFWQKLPTKFKKFYAEFENMMVSCRKFCPLLCRGGRISLVTDTACIHELYPEA